MLAVIEIGGRQYRVSPNQTFYAELTDGEVGSEIQISNILMVKNGSDIKIGTPYVSGSVRAKILAEVKGPKIEGFRYRKKTNYHRRWGHRQRYHKLQITAISA